MGYSSFYRQGHRFRNELSSLYMDIRRLATLAYGDNFAVMFEWDKSGTEAGHLSNMVVVYVWSLFDEFMRDAYIFVNPGSHITEGEIRKNTQGWSKVRKWFKSKNLLNANLTSFEPLISELDARRNCLVHKNGNVDEQYIEQATQFGGIAGFDFGSRIWTDWEYHEQLEKRLVSFQMFLNPALENYVNSSLPY
jgi:hypothetical protein